MDQETIEKLARSLTAESTELLPYLPYLPYLLQNLWELGGSPDCVAALMKKHIPNSGDIHVLDLACGKGAVSVRIAGELGAQVDGVDFFSEFIDYTEQKAGEYRVPRQCRFRTGNINETVKTARNYDCVVFCTSGNILGTPVKTLEKLKETIKPAGFIVLDESFLGGSHTGDIRYDYDYLSYTEWQWLFERHGLKEIALDIMDDRDLSEINARDMQAISRRVIELSERHPEKSVLFESYLASQQNECFDLEHHLINGVWLLQAE